MAKLVSNTSPNLCETSFYHRQYDNDIVRPEEPNTAFDHCKRIALVALPFISLCKPLAAPLSLVTDGVRGFSSASPLIAGNQEADNFQVLSGLFHTAISAASIAGTIFASPLGTLITTGHDIALNGNNLIHALNEKDYKKASEMGMQLIGSSLYLGMFLTASVQLSIAATSAQILIGLYRSGDDLKKGNYLEASGHVLMAAIRANQLRPQIQLSQLKSNQPTLSSKIKNSHFHDTEVTSYCPALAAIQNKPIETHETYNVQIVIEDGMKFHVADYGDGTIIVSCLDGPVKGLQFAYDFEVLEATTTAVEWHNDHFVHSYENGKIIITSYDHKQIAEIY